MSQMLRSQGETLDDATGLVQSHIKKNEPAWKLDYFDDKENDNPIKMDYYTPNSDKQHNYLEQGISVLYNLTNRISPTYAGFDTLGILYDAKKTNG